MAVEYIYDYREGFRVFLLLEIASGGVHPDFTHWTRHYICWVTECRSFDEQGEREGGGDGELGGGRPRADGGDTREINAAEEVEAAEEEGLLTASEEECGRRRRGARRSEARGEARRSGIFVCGGAERCAGERGAAAAGHQSSQRRRSRRSSEGGGGSAIPSALGLNV
ncbi:hypothetical protein Scep_004724 [Stephania cephalantha]|uniref:Uncharacterized protein n=1 Tax=Stephania cephalantha TaxID=152367 RepID=A0AAP0KTW3_9MAGN